MANHKVICWDCGCDVDDPLVNTCPKCGGLMVQKYGQNGAYVQCMDPECKTILRRTKKDDE